MPAMRRLLLLLLLLAVPLQISWAAVSGYCEYEREGTARHFGHHEHHKDHGGMTGSLAKLHHDCSHHAGAVAIIAESAEMSAVTSAVPVLVHSPLPPLSLLPERPERPKWQSARL